MRVKATVVEMMRQQFPDFPLYLTKRPSYFFRGVSNDLYQYVIFQRDGITGAFYVDLGITFDPLRLGRQDVDASYLWYVYGNRPENLERVLLQIAQELHRYARPYFDRMADELTSDPLIQYGRAITQQRGRLTEGEKVRLVEDIQAAQYRIDRLENTIHTTIRNMLSDYADQQKVLVEPYYLDRLAFDLIWLMTEGTLSSFGVQ
jgi:hypothetical protein